MLMPALKYLRGTFVHIKNHKPSLICSELLRTELYECPRKYIMIFVEISPIRGNELGDSGMFIACFQTIVFENVLQVSHFYGKCD